LLAKNFIPVVVGNKSGACMADVRLEDAKLGDLASIILEMFAKHTLYPGSAILIGSATHLFQEGVPGSATAWLQVLSQLNAKFKNINVCLQVQVIHDDCPGSLARDLELLSFWRSRV
jgi:hypothetical protein